MRSETLRVEYDLNYILIGVQSKVEDYQFAYFLNKSPLFFFERMQKDLSCLINQKTIYFSSFHDVNSELKRESFLIQNKSIYTNSLSFTNSLFDISNMSNAAFLVPELKDFDYFIKLVGIWKLSEIASLKKLLKNLKVVDSEVNIDLNKLKSINNLVC